MQPHGEGSDEPSEISGPKLPSYTATTVEIGPFGHAGSFWAVEPTGHQQTDIERGWRLAGEALEYAKTRGHAGAIYWPIAEMLARGRCSALELAFIERISRAAVVGSHN